jgi:hypothetical protein
MVMGRFAPFSRSAWFRLVTKDYWGFLYSRPIKDTFSLGRVSNATNRCVGNSSIAFPKVFPLRHTTEKRGCTWTRRSTLLLETHVIYKHRVP